MTPRNGLAPSNLDAAPDAALLRIVAEREERLDAAFEKLHQRHHTRLVNFLICSRGISPADAEDVAAATFLIVFRRADAFDCSQASFKTWLYRIALNRATDLLRSRRQRLLPIDGLADKLAEATPRLTDVELFVASCLRRLPEGKRRLVMLKYVEEFTELEIASILQLPLGTVSTRLAAARRHMMALLNDEPLAAPNRETRRATREPITAAQ